MIKNTFCLKEELSNYKNINMKISNMIKNKELIKIKKGLYETNLNTPGHYLSSTINYPSYLSFEFALFYHDLIPERVYGYTSATFRKNKNKTYTNEFGKYYYQCIPDDAYPHGVCVKVEFDYSFQIATKEKAICDMLYVAKPFSKQQDILDYLFKDLRIDVNDFNNLNIEELIKLCSLYKTTNHKIFLNILNKKIEKENYE